MQVLCAFAGYKIYDNEKLYTYILILLMNIRIIIIGWKFVEYLSGYFRLDCLITRVSQFRGLK